MNNDMQIKFNRHENAYKTSLAAQQAKAAEAVHSANQIKRLRMAVEAAGLDPSKVTIEQAIRIAAEAEFV